MSTNDEPFTRVASDAHAGGLSDAQSGELPYRFVGERPAARDHAHVSAMWMCPGIMPILKFSPGDMTPGQLGPMSVTGLPLRYRTTRTVSMTGMPSVMQAITDTPASAASTMASAAKGGGTKMSEASAPVSATARSTVLKTGTSPSNVCPPRPGRDARDEIRAVLAASERVKTPLAPGNALHHQLGFPAHKYAHRLSPPILRIVKLNSYCACAKSLSKESAQTAPRSRMQTKLAQSSTLQRLSTRARNTSSACRSYCAASTTEACLYAASITSSAKSCLRTFCC